MAAMYEEDNGLEWNDEEGFYVKDRTPYYGGVEFGFADEGGESALRAATHDRCWNCRRSVDEHDGWCRHCGSRLNPRDLPCGTCNKPNRLTAADKARGYHCDDCANRLERGMDFDYAD